MRALASCAGLVFGLVEARPAVAEPDVEGRTCLSAPYLDAATDRQAEIRALALWLASALHAFPGLVDPLHDEGLQLCLAEELFGIQGYYDVEAHRIVIRAGVAQPLRRAIAIHELRHWQQVRIGICPDPALSMEATARIVLAMEADASAISLAVAWQLRAAGDPSVWDALAAWPSHAAMARAFRAEVEDSGDIGLATARAFSEWYATEWLRESYYVATCSAYLDRQDESHALPRYGSIDDAFLDRLCRLPGGARYPCAEPARATDGRP